MPKLIVAILLLTSCILANDTQEKTYIFKAKGEFAEELKALMEKHSKEGKIEIEEVDNTSTFTKKTTKIVDAFLNDEELNGDIAYGKHIYDRTCYRCHGTKADKTYYPSSRVLNTLSKKELYEALESYKRDVSYGGSSRMIMYEQTRGMTTSDMVSVAAYIYSLNHSTNEAKKPINAPKNTTNDNDAPSDQGTYLK